MCALRLPCCCSRVLVWRRCCARLTTCQKWVGDGGGDVVSVWRVAASEETARALVVAHGVSSVTPPPPPCFRCVAPSTRHMCTSHPLQQQKQQIQLRTPTQPATASPHCRIVHVSLPPPAPSRQLLAKKAAGAPPARSSSPAAGTCCGGCDGGGLQLAQAQAGSGRGVREAAVVVMSRVLSSQRCCKSSA